MRINELLWDDETVEHLVRHGVDPKEAEQACRIRPHALRYLTVIVAPLGGGRARIITARTMDEAERRQYLRR